MELKLIHLVDSILIFSTSFHLLGMNLIQYTIFAFLVLKY